ncbi:GFA family protein [Thalassococcus sp. CAU 1522]|uniref:GFA family protein n=1 Tax=Thalassococcus arenae TaxID=2851652 RepID=A0ABS6N909_9RHOB|nr:GFA family protein [Thalassococcus arenae]MBV2360045.1 GFA family protein [Thalassococcus arenae]
MTDPVRATCHCGAVELRVTLSAPLSSARRCDCSYCRRRAQPTVSAPQGGVQVVRGADNLTLYQWGTKTAKHYFCKTCGIYLFHHRRAAPNDIGVNLYAIDGTEPRDFEPLGWTDGVNHPSDR